jgi:hypothetical protein
MGHLWTERKDMAKPPREKKTERSDARDLK